MRRQCTREYKIMPMDRYIRRWLLEHGFAKETKTGAIRVNKKKHKIVTYIGFTVDEATRIKPSRLKWQEFKWPLIFYFERRMSKLDCVNWLTKRDLPVPQKSSCRICPFHNRANWKRMKEERPDDWTHVVAVDDFLRGEGKNRFTASLKGELFLYKDAIPLKEVDFSIEDMQEDFTDLCDGGYCFT